jgi:hypothetical protein
VIAINTATARSAAAAALRRATRLPIPPRTTFLRALPSDESRRGPLQTFVISGDLRGLRTYLMVVAVTGASNEDGWPTTLDGPVWIRLLDAEETAAQSTAPTPTWPVLGRLQDRKLIRRVRSSPHSNRDITVTLRREGGLGRPYTHPAPGSIVKPADQPSYEDPAPATRDAGRGSRRARGCGDERSAEERGQLMIRKPSDVLAALVAVLGVIGLTGFLVVRLGGTATPMVIVAVLTAFASILAALPPVIKALRGR